MSACPISQISQNGSEGRDTFLSDTPFTPLALTMFAVLKESLGVGGKLDVDGAGLLEAGSRVVVGNWKCERRRKIWGGCGFKKRSGE